MKRSILVAVCLSMCGCVGVPTTKITGNLKAGTFSIKAPKDVVIGALKVIAKPDGSVSVEIANASGTNSPQVINSSASGTVDIINATAGVMNAAIATGVKAASKTLVP